MPDQLRKAKLTQLFIMINIAVFIIEEITGGTMSANAFVRACSLFTPAVVGEQGLYRMLSSIFIHFGAEHLFSNMAALLAAGSLIEQLMGKGWFLTVYLSAGLAGNAATVLADMLTGSALYSAGASGAVSGLIGAYMVLMAAKRTRVRVPAGNLIMAGVCILLPGITDGSINFWAHAGGLAAGAAAALIFVVIDAGKEVRG